MNVLVSDPERLKNGCRFAFLFSREKMQIVVSRSGHGKLLRTLEKADFDSGGWCCLKTGRIWPTNGTLSNVKKVDRGTIKEALESHFSTTLRWA